MIHIAFCIHDNDGNYIRHTAATMVSVFSNTQACVTVHIIHDDTLTEENKERLIELARQYNQILICHIVNRSFFEEIALKLKHALLKQSFSIGTLFRLKITEILSVDKVLYLDSDIVVNMDIQDLWNVDLDQYYIAAVRDVKATRKKITNRQHFKKMGISNEKYFNAGVILFNLKKLREEIDLFSDSINFLMKYSEDAIFFDQDALNALLQVKVLLLPETYNFIPISLPPKTVPNDLSAIIHFAGPKPWQYRCSQFDWLYWKFLSKTTWGDTVEKLLDVQKALNIDLGYAFYEGKIGSRRMLIDGVVFRIKRLLKRG